MEVTVKAYLQQPDSSAEVRRVSISLAGHGSNSGIFNEVLTKVGKAFPGLAGKMFSLKWKDSDGDLVMMSSDEEMTEALEQAQGSPLKIYITVEGMRESGADNEKEKHASSQEQSYEKSSDPEKEKPSEGYWPFMGHTGMPFPPPPPHFSFGHPMEGMRKRGHSETHNPHGHFKFHFGHMGPHGRFGYEGHNFKEQGCQFGQRGSNHRGGFSARGCHFGPLGSRAHLFGPYTEHHFGSSFDPFGGSSFGPNGGSHFGPNGGSHFGPNGGSHFRPNGRSPFGPNGASHFGPNGGSYFGTAGGPQDWPSGIRMHASFGDGHFFDATQACPAFSGSEPCCGQASECSTEENSWKAKLRDAVPKAHRRWAKVYIRNWRLNHLKNATSTSSDSDNDSWTMEDACVPEAYAAWLDIVLLKWHKQQGQDKTGASCDKEESIEKKEKKKLKASVPMEFRKWTKWYLARRYGQKGVPVFHHEGHFEVNKEQPKKHWKKSLKMQRLALSIPVEHRTWAKAFIGKWRQDHKIVDSKAEEYISSEGEGEEKKITGGTAIPDNYRPWLDRFLARWHLWRGQLHEQKVDLENDTKGDFKKTIPKQFRKWVKCYLWHRYGKGAGKNGQSDFSQYQKWLQAFQQRWLYEQSQAGSGDELVLTSSEDDDDDIETETEEAVNDLKRLRLENDQDIGRASRPETDKITGQQSAGQGSVGQQLNEDVEMTLGPHHYLRQALLHWDGKSAPAPGSFEGTASKPELIPPHLYHWMSKMMMKMQMKQMKQEMKQAKQSMKTALKAQKYK